MASFPPRLLAALDRLPETGQYLLVISNLPNLTETEQAKLKELALRKDERLASAVKVFKMNKDSTSLTSTLKGILSSPQPRSAQRASNTQADPVFEAFKAMDVDNTGFISFDNLLTVLQQLFKNLGQAAADANMSPDELAYATANESFLVADSNRNGRINYHEFREWYKTDNYKKLQGMKRMVSGGRQASGPTAALGGPTSGLVEDLRAKYVPGGQVGRAVRSEGDMCIDEQANGDGEDEGEKDGEVFGGSQESGVDLRRGGGREGVGQGGGVCGQRLGREQRQEEHERWYLGDGRRGGEALLEDAEGEGPQQRRGGVLRDDQWGG